MLDLIETGLFAPHLSGAAGQRCHMELVSIPASKMEEAWDKVCVFWKEGIVCVCVCLHIHLCEWNILLVSITVSGVPLHLSSCHSLCLSKFVADLRFGKGPDSCGELRVSHCRHISTLYFANLCLLIKGQRALKGGKKSASAALTVTECLLSAGK